MRSPSDMDILVCDLTNRCFLRCSNCTRDISHQTRTSEMTPETFRKALHSLKDWWKPGRVIGLIGGEPTLSGYFAEIVQIFRDEFNPGVLAHGRTPIGDFNAFAHQRLYDRSNGKGLWTSFGPKFRDHAELIMETFSHWNPNDHSTGEGVHQTSLVDAREMCDALGIPWEEWPNYRDACWLQNSWSASITTSGKAYFCERAAQLDSLYNGGKLGWDIEAEPHWWKRTPDQFGEQLSICEMCSMCLPGPGQVDTLDMDIISKNHVERLVQIGSPAVKGGRYELFDPAVHVEHRVITKKDNYVAPSGIRVSNDNPHIRPKSVSAIVVCVGRSEHLAKTLPRLIEQVNRVYIVTNREDEQTIQLIPSGYTGILCTEHPKDHAFNKGYYLNMGLRAAAHDDPDWILFTDSDVMLNENFRKFFFNHSWNPGCLYYTARSGSDSPPGINEEPNGFFQLWHPKASAIRDRWPSVMSENFCSAGGIDSWFMQQYPRDKLVYMPELAVSHIEHGTFGSGWNGTETGPRWRQVGMLSLSGFIPLNGNRIDSACRLKLTDTLFGQTVEVDVAPGQPIPDVVLNVCGRDILFLGRNIGQHHIHVAKWGE